MHRSAVISEAAFRLFGLLNQLICGSSLEQVSVWIKISALVPVLETSLAERLLSALCQRKRLVSGVSSFIIGTLFFFFVAGLGNKVHKVAQVIFFFFFNNEVVTDVA